MVRSREEISKSIDTDHVFPGKCFRFLSRRLGIKTLHIDSRPLLSRIANNAGVRKIFEECSTDDVGHQREFDIIWERKAMLYGACLAQGEKLHQVQLAEAANLSVVTLRK
jgi:transcription initiation factor TFIIB